MYLPFIGMLSLPATELQNDTTLTVQYSINITSGDIAVQIKGKQSGKIVCTSSGNCAVPVAYCATGINTSKLTSGVATGIGTVASAIGAYVSGGSTLALSGIIGGGLLSTSQQLIDALGGTGSGGAGLGGGSSDAATVIVAVNQIYNLGLSEGEMCAVAAELGSDTSFFVCGTPQLCTSRGEVMTPFELDILQGKWIAIVKPPFGVSTPQAYAGVKPAIPAVPLAERLKADPSEWHKNITNDFESTVFAQFPSLAVIKQSLYDSGALYASMSGSGSAMFGLFDSEPKLEFAEDYFVFVGRV
jgi:hypothetical protein